MPGIVLSPSDFARMQRAVLWFERHAINDGQSPPVAPGAQNADMVPIAIAGPANVDGLYPCTIQLLTDPAGGGDYDDLGDAWALPLNGETLTEDSYYFGRPASTYEEEDEGEAPVFLVDGRSGGGGGSLKLRGTLAGTLSFGSSATMNIAGGGTVTVYDWLLSTGQSIASSIQVTAFLDADGKYYVDGAQCP